MQMFIVAASAVMVAFVWFASVRAQRTLSALLDVERARVERLLDRLEARSLEQYHAIVGPEPEAVDYGAWVHDPTGLMAAQADTDG